MAKKKLIFNNFQTDSIIPLNIYRNAEERFSFSYPYTFESIFTGDIPLPQTVLKFDFETRLQHYLSIYYRTSNAFLLEAQEKPDYVTFYQWMNAEFSKETPAEEYVSKKLTLLKTYIHIEQLLNDEFVSIMNLIKNDDELYALWKQFSESRGMTETITKVRSLIETSRENKKFHTKISKRELQTITQLYSQHKLLNGYITRYPMVVLANIKGKRVKDKAPEDTYEKLQYFIKNHFILDAFKLIGSLEDKLPKEELHYYEGLTSYKIGEFDRALHQFKQMDEQNRFYEEMMNYKLDIFALQGDKQKIYEHQQKNPPLTKDFYHYLMQHLTLQGTDTLSIDYLETTNPYHKLQYVTNSVHLILSYFEKLKVIESQKTAALQSLYKDEEITKELQDEDFTNLIECINQWTDFSVDDVNQPLIEIDLLKYLWLNSPSLTDDIILEGIRIFQALSPHHFTKFVLLFIDYIIGQPRMIQFECLTFAYLQNDSDDPQFTECLLGYLESFPEFQEKKEQLDSLLEQNSWVKQLSPMGQAAWRSNENIFLNISENTDSISDAGMLCLGYFRIIELELNQKLILQILPKIEWDSLLTMIQEVEGDKQKPWLSLYSNLLTIHKKDKTGLELGPLEFLLGKISKIRENDVDVELKKLFYQYVFEILTPTGKEQLKQGNFAKMITSDVRMKYRNRPAHAQFVTIRTAREARNYVTQILRQMHEWFEVE
ncbi:hypothetical protein SAMN05880501_10892 [Ureibacillus xyleni]|uniref:Uncharacterized protein n=1 Tax=Ureibacillus xyleni TaxID=614648 RepID=A0A285T2A1_9BACL|nr:hypothetical protein [Ureibacillus xyleni]SOC15452.1 hypothetical protein SAMN05880501_10892 [Ureibacillus xyleni]